MNLGLVMLMATALLVLGHWLWVAMPEYRLRQLGQRFGAAREDLMTRDMPTLIQAVQHALDIHYTRLYHATRTLVTQFDEFAGPDASEFVREWLEQVPGTGVSGAHLQDLEGILWEMEDDVQNPWEYAVEADRLSRDVDRLMRALRKFERLRAQLAPAPA